MIYKAKYGKVQTGDYVIVVTNNYMNRSTDISIGLVSDDDYVYMGVSRDYGQKPKPIRREIGSFGCPVCKIPSVEVPNRVKKELQQSLKLQAEKPAKKFRKFELLHIVTLYSGVTVVEKQKEIINVKTSTLPERAKWEEIYSKLFQNLRSRYYDFRLGEIRRDGPVKEICEGKEVTSEYHEVFIREVGEKTFRNEDKIAYKD